MSSDRSEALIAASRVLLLSSRERILRSRRRAAASQVLTRPLRGGADNHEYPVTPIGLRGRIRTMLNNGYLPPLTSRRSWLGQGHGDVCPLCTQTITPSHWQREVEAPPLGEVRVHTVCFRMWLEESGGLEKSA
jgi:hypothetical protein